MTHITTRRRALRTAPKFGLHPVTLLWREWVAPAVDCLLRQPESSGQIDRPPPEKLDRLLLCHTPEYRDIYSAASRARQDNDTERDNSVVTTFQERLAESMQLAGSINQPALARLIGCTKMTISSALKRDGIPRMLSAENAIRAAKALDVDPVWLVLGEGEARPPYYRERRALSARAVYIGALLDAIKDPERNAKAYALVVQLLEFNV